MGGGFEVRGISVLCIRSWVRSGCCASEVREERECERRGKYQKAFLGTMFEKHMVPNKSLYEKKLSKLVRSRKSVTRTCGKNKLEVCLDCPLVWIVYYQNKQSYPNPAAAILGRSLWSVILSNLALISYPSVTPRILTSITSWYDIFDLFSMKSFSYLSFDHNSLTFCFRRSSNRFSASVR